MLSPRSLGEGRVRVAANPILTKAAEILYLLEFTCQEKCSIVRLQPEAPACGEL
jgi:hypothetical protein